MCIYIYWAGAGSDLAFECVSAVAGIKKKKKEALQVHLWKTNRLTNTASQGPFPLFHMPEAPSHTVNQEACVSLTVCLARTNMEHP